MAPDVGVVTLKIAADTSEFDAAMRRMRRSIRGPIWLPIYSAAVTVAAATLALIDLLHH
jgi:hypothetical protein